MRDTQPESGVQRCCLLIAAWLCACALAGCAQPGAKKTNNIELPSFGSELDDQVFGEYCKPLGSGALQGLLQALNAGNLQLDQAWSRFRQAQAQAEQQDARRWPTITAQLESSRRKSTSLPAPLAEQLGAGDGVSIESSYRASLAAEYELDLWRRLASSAEAAEFEALATRADARAMAVTLSAQLMESWFDLAFQQRQMDLLQSQVEAARQLLELSKLRFTQGQSSALDAIQQKQQLEALQASLSQSELRQQVSRNQIAVLVGQSPSRYQVKGQVALPELQPLNDQLEIGASLLARRPDLRSAYYRLQSSDARLASAMAQRLPSVRINASLFDQNAELGGLGDNLFWNLAAAVAQPLFTGGRIEAGIDAARAGTEASIAGYRQSLLTALQELMNAWWSEQQSVERLAHLREQQALAENAYHLVQRQFQRGMVDFLRVLDAFQAMVNAQQELLREQRQRVSYRVQFCRALGDEWTAEDTKQGNLNS